MLTCKHSMGKKHSIPAKQFLYSYSRLTPKINSWQWLVSASQVENGLLSIILQTWHDLDLSQLWKQGCHKSKYINALKIQNICDKNWIKIFFNISPFCCQRFSHLLSQQTCCANIIWRNFHSNVFNLYEMHNWQTLLFQYFCISQKMGNFSTIKGHSSLD